MKTDHVFSVSKPIWDVCAEAEAAGWNKSPTSAPSGHLYFIFSRIYFCSMLNVSLLEFERMEICAYIFHIFSTCIFHKQLNVPKYYLSAAVAFFLYEKCYINYVWIQLISLTNESHLWHHPGVKGRVPIPSWSSTNPKQDMYTGQKYINTTFLFMLRIFLSWTQRSKTFSICSK